MISKPDFKYDIIKEEVIIDSYELHDFIDDAYDYPFVLDEYYFERTDILIRHRKIKYRRLRIKKKFKPMRRRILKMVGQVVNIQPNVVANDILITVFNGLKTASTFFSDVWKHLKKKSKMHPIFLGAIYHTRLHDFLPKMDSFQPYMADLIPYKNIQYRVFTSSQRYKEQHYLSFFKEIIILLKRQVRMIARKNMLRKMSSSLILGSYCSSARRYKKYSFVYFFGFKYKIRNPKRKNRGYLRKLKKLNIVYNQNLTLFKRKKIRKLTLHNSFQKCTNL